jgi:ADP-ribosylglycohydrolase
MALAESLVACGQFDPDDFARRMTAIDIRGIGRATRDFVTAWHRNGGTWRGAGQPSSGNGAMMRAAPAGLLVHPSIESLRKLASLQATVSHDDHMARASSVALAIGVARLIRMEHGALDAVEARVAFLKSVASAIEGMENGKQYLTRKDGKPASLYHRLSGELPELMMRGASLDDIQEEFWSGAYVLESGPMAFACFLASPEDFDTVVIEAGCKTRDSDTVAAIAGNLAGSFVGIEGIGKQWLDELEYREELTELGRNLSQLEITACEAD